MKKRIKLKLNQNNLIFWMNFFFFSVAVFLLHLDKKERNKQTILFNVICWPKSIQRDWPLIFILFVMSKWKSKEKRKINRKSEKAQVQVAQKRKMKMMEMPMTESILIKVETDVKRKWWNSWKKQTFIVN